MSGEYYDWNSEDDVDASDDLISKVKKYEEEYSGFSKDMLEAEYKRYWNDLDLAITEEGRDRITALWNLLSSKYGYGNNDLKRLRGE